MRRTRGRCVRAATGAGVRPTVEPLETRTLLAAALDAGFGAGGQVATGMAELAGVNVLSGIGAIHDGSASLAVLPDGRFVVAGHSAAAGPRDFAIRRYDALGRPDPSFGTDGRATVDFGADDLVSAVAVEPDGHVIAAGLRQTPGVPAELGSWRLAVARLNPDGTVDRTFIDDEDRGLSGLFVLPMDIEPQGDGGFLVAVTDTFRGALVQAYHPDGTKTERVVFPRESPDSHYRVELRPRGDGTFDFLAHGLAVHVARLRADGSPDATFGDGGTVTVGSPFESPFGPSAGPDVAAEVQPDGSVLRASERLVVQRVAVGDAPLPDFGLHGRTRIGLAALSDQVLARDVRVQPDGRIVVLLSDRFRGTGGAVVRFSPAGALEGAIQWHGGADGPFAARVLAIAPDGGFLVAGRSTPLPPLGAEDGGADVTVARFHPAALAPLPAPDLTATLRVRPPRLAKYGSHGRATVVFQNIGTEPADGWINGTLDLRAPDGTTPATLNIIEQDLNLPPGGSFTRRVRWSLEQGIPAGPYTFSLTLASNAYWESNDTNNVIAGPPVQVARYFIDPSLESAAPAAALVRGQPARVDAWVSNLGNRTSKQAFRLDVRLTSLDRPSSMNARAELDIPRRALRGGGRRPYSVLFDLPATLTPGKYRLQVSLNVIPGYAGVGYNADHTNDTITVDVTLA